MGSDPPALAQQDAAAAAAASPQRRHLFISYTGRDLAWARWIADELQAAGYQTYFQDQDFRKTGSFLGEMNHGLTHAAATVAVVSRDYFESEMCTAEWRAAFASDPTCRLGKLILVRVGVCQVEPLLAPVTRVELDGVRRIEAARALLLKGVADAPAAGEAKSGIAPSPAGSPVRRRAVFPGDKYQRAAVRAARFALVWWLVFDATQGALAGALPAWNNSRPGDLQLAGGVVALVVALAVDLGWAWWRGRR